MERRTLYMQSAPRFKKIHLKTLLADKSAGGYKARV